MKISDEAKTGLVAAAVGAALLGLGALSWRLLRKGGALLGPQPLAKGSTVLLLGDSLGVGISAPLREQLDAAGLSLISQPHVGWTAKQTNNLLTSSPELVGDAVVYSLGSNDGALFDPSSEADSVRSLVDTARARGARRIVWIVPPNFALSSPPAPATTEKQQAFAALWPSDVERLQGPTDLLGSDRIHLPPAGYRALAESVSALLLT